MSQNYLNNHEVIPEIESNLFDGHEESRFAVGIVACGDEIVSGLEGEFQGYKLLRGNVYAKQKGYMSEADLEKDGTESDPDDRRSVHFVVVENAVRNPRVVGAMRLIIKAHDGAGIALGNDELLPIESHYPEAFHKAAAEVPSNESSRLISRHEDARAQRGIKWLLFTAGVSYVQEKSLGPTYGAVEPILSRSMQIEGMPVTELGDAKYVEEFKSSKLPIKIDVDKLAEKIEGQTPGALQEAATSQFMYSGIKQYSGPATVPAA